MFDVLTLPPFVSACIQGLGVACIGRRASMSGMSASMMLCSGLQASAFCRVKFQVVVQSTQSSNFGSARLKFTGNK
eukprot:scaffold224155_cov66-Cyclotella_meneghiniana.AAC.2